MTLSALKSTIAFEAKIPDIDALGGWVDLTFAEILNGYTAQIKYDQLFVPNVVINATVGNGVITLPSDIQHLDLNKITYRYNSDSDNDFYLEPTQDLISDLNDGQTNYVLLTSTNVNAGILNVYPYADLTTSDQFIFSYWKKPSSVITDDSSILIPDELIQTVKLELIARANMFGDGKQAMFFRGLANAAHANSLGVTRLPGSNE